jgi:hypothetical protein
VPVVASVVVLSPVVVPLVVTFVVVGVPVVGSTPVLVVASKPVVLVPAVVPPLSPQPVRTRSAPIMARESFDSIHMVFLMKEGGSWRGGSAQYLAPGRTNRDDCS